MDKGRDFRQRHRSERDHLFSVHEYRLCSGNCARVEAYSSTITTILAHRMFTQSMFTYSSLNMEVTVKKLCLSLFTLSICLLGKGRGIYVLTYLPPS